MPELHAMYIPFICMNEYSPQMPSTGIATDIFKFEFEKYNHVCGKDHVAQYILIVVF
jgi:hypothetical protein